MQLNLKCRINTCYKNAELVLYLEGPYISYFCLEHSVYKDKPDEFQPVSILHLIIEETQNDAPQEDDDIELITSFCSKCMQIGICKKHTTYNKIVLNTLCSFKLCDEVSTHYQSHSSKTFCTKHKFYGHYHSISRVENIIYDVIDTLPKIWYIVYDNRIYHNYHPRYYIEYENLLKIWNKYVDITLKLISLIRRDKVSIMFVIQYLNILKYRYLVDLWDWYFETDMSLWFQHSKSESCRRYINIINMMIKQNKAHMIDFQPRSYDLPSLREYINN